jgi:hypothetical protein
VSGTSTRMTADETARAPPAAPRQAREVRLRDGSRVLVRPTLPGDEDLLADGFARLSDDSRRLRFLAAKPSLSPAEVRYFASVDGTDHDAVGVETFVAEVAAENSAARDFLFKAAPCRRTRMQAAVAEYELDLTRARVVRAAA